MSCIRQKLQVRGFSPETIKIIESSWRSGTKSQYQSVARKWFEFCNLHNCDYVTAPVSIALDFLSDLFASGLSYSYINTARSCLSSLLLYEDSSVPFGQLPLVKRFMKGIFELRPSFPRYTISWSISTVFDFIRATPLYTLSLKDLSYRVAFLLSLLSGQRCQTITSLSLDNMIKSDDKFIFLITEKLKHTRTGVHQSPLEFQAYPYDSNICIVSHLQKYLEMTSELRNSSQQLLISFIKPHRPVSRETVSQWIKNFMSLAGIDTTKYKSHSTRGASASYLAAKHFDVKDIMSAAGWSKEETFRRFYNFEQNNRFNYGTAILDSVVSS